MVSTSTYPSVSLIAAGARPEQDTFFVAVTVPQVTLPAFDFMAA